MRHMLFTIFLAASLFGNYAHQGENSGKIDMHGGKSDSLVKKNKNFSNSNLSPFGTMGLSKEVTPKKQPSSIKKEQKKTQKNTNK